MKGVGKGQREKMSRWQKHGHTKNRKFSPTYHSWVAMKTRCLNPNRQSHKYYTDKGITVCAKWMKFEGFLEDMGIRPESMTIDRIDSDRGYYKDNCRWATLSQQAHNTKIDTSNSTNKYRGVSWHKETQWWRSRIGFEGKVLSLGCYKNEVDAAKAYDKKAKELHGEFARLNFTEEN